MASSSSSSSTPKWTYDVFLSFRGEDTRTNFVDHLYTALEDRAIYIFKDDQKLKRGKSINPELLKAIEQSRFAIVVFSRNYADSSWCLDELVKIIDCKNSIGQTVLPVFYYVDPSEVRKRKRSFGEAFAKHESNLGKDEYQIQRWKNALAEAASISGWALSNTANGHESKCIKEIVGNILTNLGYSRASSLADNLIGMVSRVQNVKSLLLTGSDEVQILGILGMGGMGKTTLARAVFNDLSHQFEGRSFIANVREVSKSRRGLQSLQEKVLSEILMERELKVPSIDNGIIMMSRLCHKRVLLVLDDVDDVEQLEALAGKRDWFGKGSRIIITTRDKHLLVVLGVNEIHNAVLLNDDEALHLFSKYAFKSNSPPEEYLDTSCLVVRNVRGLPLALKVLGSFLYGRTMVEWKGALNRLTNHFANKKILGVLKISFDGLERNEQEIFLDIACFFIGMKKDDASEILDCFDFYPDIGLSVLEEKSLLNVSDGTLQMHDLIKELAWDIVYQMDPKEPGRRSRLWLPEDVHAVLTNDTGTESIEGIKLHSPRSYSFRAFQNMKKLRLLDVSNISEPEFECLMNELRWIRWDRYPSKSLPASFQAEKLVHLRMPYSNMVELWRGKKILDKLKLVDLSYSSMLTRTPDFSGAPNLEKLILHFCYRLKEIHPSLGGLQRLTILDLSKCEKLKVFPQILGDMKKLTKLYLNNTAIKKVHPSIGKLTGLVILDLSYCRYLKCLPSTICCLKCLKTLRLAGCSRLKELPETLGQMACLEELHLNGNYFTCLPDNLCQLSKLKVLELRDCTKLELLTELPSSIAMLNMDGCESLESIGNLLTTKHDLHVVSFRNCFKLTENEHCSSNSNNNSSSSTDMLLRTMLQWRWVTNHHQFSILVPGREIPDWISLQVDEKRYQTSSSSLELKLPPNWDRRIAGFAMCFVLWPRIPGFIGTNFPNRLRISLGHKYDKWLQHSSWLFEMFASSSRLYQAFESHHVWLGYISLDLFGQQIFGDKYKKDDDWVGGTKESFLRIDYGDPNDDVQKFGIHVVYKEDVKQMIEEEDHNNSISESSRNFGFFSCPEDFNDFI